MLKNFTLKFSNLSLLLTLLVTTNLQSQCPGCTVDLPGNLAADTIFLEPIPNGTVGAAYDEDISFRLPKSTTPVAASDPSVPAGIDLDDIKILFITNLPPGLAWETNQDSYDTNTNPDGCVKFCGVPFADGTFVLDIVLEVEIGPITQETSFQQEITILPSVSINDGFTMTNSAGCGAVTVAFTNNVPSNGNSGFSYLWDFGNGNASIDEDPVSQTFSSPGTYPIDYQAIIDTSGFVLTNIRVIDSDCSDLFSAPDIYLDIIDPNGNSTVTPQIVNTNPPVEFAFNIPLVDGNYTLIVKDDDSGLNGADDECDFYSFNKFSNGILVNGGSAIDITIFHPVDTVTTTDSVYVYPVPDQPEIIYTTPPTWCEDENIILTSSYSSNNQWLLDSLPIVGATGTDWQVLASGSYTLAYTNSFGCSAVSEALDIALDPLPEIPLFNNTDNLLEVIVPGILPSNYALQWYYENTLLPGETGLTYCLSQTGTVTLVVTDNDTGCTNSFTTQEDFDPDFACGAVSISELIGEELKIFPNPFSENINIEFELNKVSDFQINVYDLLGRKNQIEAQQNFSGIFQRSYSFDTWSEGVYLLEIDFGDHQLHRKLILQR
ncbi:MAG: T9SS type A sorting domain-containing protein [Bacteroidota bacterium]